MLAFHFPDDSEKENFLVRDDDPGFIECGASTLAQARSVICEAEVIIIQVLASQRYRLSTVDETPTITDLSNQAIILFNQYGTDRFFIGDRKNTMPKLISCARSNFSAPTISTLNDALEQYKKMAANVTCLILADVWIGGQDGPRLVFINKPEATMRKSLYNFLSSRLLGDVTVRQEHNTDENKPVDLSVNWFGQALRALIEIKWVGASKSSSGGLTQYRSSRVQEGANQLVDYVDRETKTDPNSVIRGYLVVFDGRRRGLQSPDNLLTKKNAVYYRNCKISLKNNPMTSRPDIEPLIRYFLEPRPSFFCGSSQS